MTCPAKKGPQNEGRKEKKKKASIRPYRRPSKSNRSWRKAKGREGEVDRRASKGGKKSGEIRGRENRETERQRVAQKRRDRNRRYVL